MSDEKDRCFRGQFKGKNKVEPHLPFKSGKISSSPNVAWKNKIYIYHGSIVDDEITDDIDAVVIPANERLWADGTGVCGAVTAVAGYDELQKDCDEITSRTEDHSIPNGQTAVTDAYALNVNHIYHTVAPCEQNNDDLTSCYYSALESCVITGDRSIALPCIGTGDGNFSKKGACSIALGAVKDWLCNAAHITYKDFMQKFKPQKWQNSITDDRFIYMTEDETVADRIDYVVICIYDQENWDIYKATIAQVYPSSDNAHSYLWIDRMKSIEYEHRISLMNQRIHSLQMENNQIRSAHDDTKEDTTDDPCKYKIESISNDLVEEQKRFMETYDEDEISERIQSFPEQRITIMKDILMYSKHVQKMKETVHVLNTKVQQMKQFMLASIPDTMEYKEWNVDDILTWVASLENGKFAEYIEALKVGLIESEITCGETLPELTRSDLSVPPFSIHSFPVKRDLVKYFSTLKTETEGNETM